MINSEIIQKVLKTYHIDVPVSETDWQELWDEILPNLIQVDPDLLDDLEMQTGLIQASGEDLDRVGLVIQALIQGSAREHQIAKVTLGGQSETLYHQRASQVVAAFRDGQFQFLNSTLVPASAMHRSDLELVDQGRADNIDLADIQGPNLAQVKKEKTTRKVGSSQKKSK